MSVASFVPSAPLQERAELGMATLSRQALDLIGIVAVDEGLDGVDSGKDGPPAEERGTGAGQKAGHTPEGEKDAPR